MFTKEIKIEAKELLKKDDNYYFPGIWLGIIPALLFAIPMELLMKGGVIHFLVGLVSLIIYSFFGAWFLLWTVNIAFNKGKTIRESIPSFKIYIVYLILSGINELISLILLPKDNPSSINGLFVIIAMIISFIICSIITLITISYVKEGTFNCGKILSLLGKTIIKILILQITFIPLYFFIGITIGIAAFWKMTYIEQANTLLIKKIYEGEI